MKPTNVGKALLASYALALFMSIFGPGFHPEISDNLMGIAVIGILIFSLWSGIILTRMK